MKKKKKKKKKKKFFIIFILNILINFNKDFLNFYILFSGLYKS